MSGIQLEPGWLARIQIGCGIAIAGVFLLAKWSLERE
jgi:hypothetical protein